MLITSDPPHIFLKNPETEKVCLENSFVPPTDSESSSSTNLEAACSNPRGSRRLVCFSNTSKLLFSDLYLNLMAKAVRHFLKGKLEWYYLSVDQAPDFISNKWILKMYCKDEKGRFHYLAVCPSGFFERQVWGKLETVDKCARLIQEPMELVRILVGMTEMPEVNYELPPESRWILASLWNEGLQALFEDENVKSPPPDFCFPVKRNFKPTKKGETKFFLYLKDGSPLYFERDESLLHLNDEEWTNLQLKLGNRLI